jgi:endogenous inhibitor of DNA gyrase (YacG/DUF329 family)
MGDAVTFKPRRPCPICKKPSQPKFHPFCSNRCTQIDLSRWLGGQYAVPTEEEGQSSPEGDTND